MSHADLAAGVWRLERSRLVGAAAKLLRDLDEAEDCAQDALMAALDAWPRDGAPANPAAWLMTATRNKALDRLRRRAMLEREHEHLAADDEAYGTHVVPDFVDQLDAARDQAEIGDELLRLIFIACHPVLPREAQVALTLRLLGGLETAEIARAFLQPEPTVAQRIVRAKKALHGQAFELPGADERTQRLQAVLAVVYLIFNEGHSAGSGATLLRPALCDEALRLARQLQHLLPGEGEVHGLAALLEIQASRLPARLDAQGRPVLLPDQDRRRWDALLIRRGLAALDQAQSLGTPGPYTLQAAIAACHARAARAEDTDWPAIVAGYDQLLALNPSPVIALNRAVAISFARGPAAAWPLLQALAGEPQLQRYPWLAGAQADVLERLGRVGEAREAYLRAAELTDNAVQRELLTERARRLAS
ncbi:RNA polymerase sigma factor [Roseateles puraquae]|uniref:RNA polymerase subunit sigma-24 n=1 Tax=Roseateles puraquae TaxID=431059 RepID=A0A254N8C2_9BURK|nr:sigma-70 family RNA polymerase sigma factor [Roseateles puraquae]MDG0856243.1 sigma-70 family RNA polymerase sigma factor [Roseateles puraquae]OWR03062.1 RNA polymerase subunit sigma-24 [Roseateles puraquae]